MRKLGVIAAVAALGAAHLAWGQESAFDACEVFTADDAKAALGTEAAGEPVNPKVKKPKVIPSCTYNGFKDGKAVAASALFKFGRNDADAQKAFDEARMQFQTKPMLIPGSEAAFWSAKTGQLNLRKGRTWVTVSVGSPRLSERDLNDAKKLAEILAKKM